MKKSVKWVDEVVEELFILRGSGNLNASLEETRIEQRCKSHFEAANLC